MQPDRSRPRPAVEREGDRTPCRVRHVVARVGDKEHAGRGIAVVLLEHQRPGRRRVSDGAPVDLNRVLCLLKLLYGGRRGEPAVRCARLSLSGLPCGSLARRVDHQNQRDKVSHRPHAFNITRLPQLKGIHFKRFRR